jgi:hypothetical protein
MAFEQKLTRRQVLLAKVEPIVGTDASPSAASNALMVLDGSAVTPGGERVSDNRLSAFLSKQPHGIGMLVSGYTGKHELRGGQATGQAVAKPETDPLLLAAGFLVSAIVFVPCGNPSGTYTPGETIEGGNSGAVGTLIDHVNAHGVQGLLLEGVSGTFQDAETLTGDTSSAVATSSDDPVTGWQYLPTSTPEDMAAATIHRYLHGHRHRILGSRANWTLNLPVGQPGIFDFTTNGIYTDPTEETQPTPTLSSHLPPLVVYAGLKVGTYAPVGVNAITLSPGNALAQDKDLNAETGLNGYIITDRDPSGSIDPKADSLDNFNPFDIWKAGTTARLSLLVGSAMGNRCYILCPEIQYTDAPTYNDRDGVATYGLNFQPKSTAGDTEIRLCYF